MAKCIHFLLILVVLFFLQACSETQDQEEVLARINDYELTLSEFETALQDELEMASEYKLTQAGKKDFLSSLLRREVLIQEARKRELDQQEEFVRTIERYWESTLIRNLMQQQGKAIADRVVVTEEEIRDRYERLKAQNPDIPGLETIRERLIKELEEEKKSRRLEAWVQDLLDKAEVSINEALLEAGMNKE